MVCSVCEKEWHVPSQGGVVYVNGYPTCGEQVCRDWVCKYFAPKSPKKDAFGRILPR
jgi:hypothetical protein